jgi:phosphoglycolate phosphatase
LTQAPCGAGADSSFVHTPRRAIQYKLAIFDFDGTLADSFPFFVSVFDDLASRHGFRTLTPHEIEALRGVPARDVMRHVGMPLRKLPVVAKDFIALVRERRHLISPFPGAREVLTNVRRAGVEIGIVSSNANDNIISILGNATAGAVTYFACGMSIFGKRAHLRRLLKRAGVDRSCAIYIGDHSTDLEAAKAEGIAFGAVSWGYGDFEYLRQAGAEHVFRNFSDVAQLLIPGTELPVGPDA